MHWWSRLSTLRSVRHADVVILQRRLLPAWQFGFLRKAAPLFVFDFDDAVFLRDSYSPRGLHCRRRLRRFKATVQAADAVLAGNPFLAEQAAKWGGSSRIQVMPTCVDPRRYPVAEHVPNGPGVQLVWIGSSSTLQGLEAIRPWLEQVGQHWPGLSLKLICDHFLSLRHLPVRECPWTEASEASELAEADIGISWLPDDLWSQGKCGLKVLQYMAAGLPVVANPVGVQADLVRPGETGFLVETQGQWVDAIGRLAHDPRLRRRMGEQGRRRVEAEFSVAAGEASWLALLANLRRRTVA
jgi:glycosyltransferase involved in cell wall biosynthesis